MNAERDREILRKLRARQNMTNAPRYMLDLFRREAGMQRKPSAKPQPSVKPDESHEVTDLRELVGAY